MKFILLTLIYVIATRFTLEAEPDKATIASKTLTTIKTLKFKTSHVFKDGGSIGLTFIDENDHEFMLIAVSPLRRRLEAKKIQAFEIIDLPTVNDSPKDNLEKGSAEEIALIKLIKSIVEKPLNVKDNPGLKMTIELLEDRTKQWPF